MPLLRVDMRIPVLYPLLAKRVSFFFFPLFGDFDTLLSAFNPAKMENIFRKDYRELSEEEVAQVRNMKDKAWDLYSLLVVEGESKADPRAMAVARTKLEEVVMWATKSITA